ncbi:multiple resistance and pH regulation F family protein [Rickettsia bellii str. RML An4]|uniref:Multiple resistance and pH regulation F family protein n=1 Tax=Rickettsia bellii str. RML An4 TaxID=1359193 RepID=A0A0F3QAV1_RICBE|nr:multiple resistance and pH regulation F family protein [Rickettsia bellii str. RML An4]
MSLFICCLGLYLGNSSYLDIAIIYFLLSFIATNGYLKYFVYESSKNKAD